MNRGRIATACAASLFAVGALAAPASAQLPDTGSLGGDAGSAGNGAGMGSSDPKVGSTDFRVADLPRIPALPTMPGMGDPADAPIVFVPVPLGSVAADLPVLPLPFVWEGTPAPDRISPARPDEPVIGSIGCSPGAPGCDPRVLDKTIDHCATAVDGIYERGMTWFTDGTTGFTERCAAEFFG